MIDNLSLKRGLIIQSLSPAFLLLIIRHFHFDYPYLIDSFFSVLNKDPISTLWKTLNHPRFGELLIVFIGAVWVILAIVSIAAFKDVHDMGVESHGEKAIEIEEQKGAAASFLMTFIFPLLIDKLCSPQCWISYLLVIVVVYSVLDKSNLYYQNPVLAIMGYRIFKFKVVNPYGYLEKGKEYIGITYKNKISEESAIMRKYIADDVFLIYNEGNS